MRHGFAMAMAELHIVLTVIHCTRFHLAADFENILESFGDGGANGAGAEGRDATFDESLAQYQSILGPMLQACASTPARPKSREGRTLPLHHRALAAPA